MKASIILAHPYSESFNHAIYHTVLDTLRAHDVSVFCHDLYQEGFDPVLTVEELGKAPTRDPLVLTYTHELQESELLVFIHPNWWGQPPAILKGYIDRVIRPPYAYDFPEGDSGGGLPIGKLKGKIGIVFNTSNTEADREDSYFHDPLAFIWERCVFGFCGIERSYREMFRVVADSTDTQRQQWLAQVADLVSDICRTQSG